jgi:hypothetical protein
MSNESIKLKYGSSGIKPASYSKKLEKYRIGLCTNPLSSSDSSTRCCGAEGHGAVPSVYKVCNEVALWVINTLSILWSEIMP